MTEASTVFVGRREELERLGLRGFDVAWGDCRQDGGAPLCWPWERVMRGLLRLRGTAGIRRALGKGAPIIGRMHTTVAERFPSPSARGAPENPLTEKSRFNDAMPAVLMRVPAERPLVIVLDDLQWSDEPSLRLPSLSGTWRSPACSSLD